MKKKKVLKRAVDIAVKTLCKGPDCFIVDDVRRCPVESGELDGCDQCIKRFIMRKAREELRNE